MSVVRGGIISTFALVISATLLAVYGSTALAEDSPYHDHPYAALDSSRSSVLSLVPHVVTADDVDALKARFGVRLAGEIYEPLTVDGFGTGLTPRTEAEWQQLVGRLVMYEVEALPEDTPGTFDLSSDPAFPIVGNQASQGSCSAWAAAYYSYGYLEAVDNGWVEASTGNLEQLMSPAWTYNMVNGGRDMGSWIDTNMFVITDWGTATLATMPYDDGDATSWGSPEAFREAPLHRASEVGYLEFSPDTTVEAIKALVTAGTPVAFAMDANEYTGGFSDGNYILSSAEYSSTDLNHAQTIVGFDDTLSDDSDTGAFRVVNSWGSDWGDSGYYWFTYSALEELGTLGVLNSNFIVDIPDYNPSLLAVWHFDTAPSRSSVISASVGAVPSPENTKSPFYDGGFHSNEVFPTFMCLDMTELGTTFWSSGGMHLSVGDSMDDGLVSSFRVEAYEPQFVPGRASQISSQSADVPAETPTSVSAYLEYYAPMSAGEALESSSVDWPSSGQAAWVAVDHTSSGDGDSMQSGDVSDGAYSRLECQVEGPAEVSFDWKVSSQSGKDVLRFLVDEVPLEIVSGDSDWATVAAELDSGTHVLAWQYLKDGSSSLLEDSGWVDSVVITAQAVEPPVIALADSYSVWFEELFTVEPSTLEYPYESVVMVWYDWGDATSWSMSTSAEGYSAAHTYAAPGTYLLTAYAADDSGNNVSDSAPVHVLEPNIVPSVVVVSEFLEGDYVLPGSAIVFDVEATDPEGGSITVVSDYGDGSDDDVLSEDSVLPGETITLQFSHSFAAGSDDPYYVTFTSMDGDEHVDVEWDSDTVQVLVNSPPTALVSVYPDTSETGTTFSFDASGSTDMETDPAEVQYRWDWTDDGVWDTDWSTEASAYHSYEVPGAFEATVEVIDGAGLSSSASVTVLVTGEAIPEFSLLVVPIVATLMILFLARSAARRRDE